MIGRVTPRKLNADTDERSLRADEMKNAVNLSVDADSQGDGGVVKLADGNLSTEASDVLAQIDQEGVNTVIGSVSDEELGVVYFFVHNSLNNHSVYAYSSKTNTYRLILKSSTLNFDENGFVKGDVVRIKRRTELGEIEEVLNQGEDGGVVPGPVDGGGGPPEPPEPTDPSEINIGLERDLSILVELSEDIYDLASAQSQLNPTDFELVITGTYSEDVVVGRQRRSVNQSVVFYNESDDLNTNPDGLSEFTDSAISVIFNQVSKTISVQTTSRLFVAPQVASNPTLSFSCELKFNDTIKTQDWNEILGGGISGVSGPASPGQSISSEVLNETIIVSVSNNEYQDSTIYSAGFCPSFTRPSKNASTLAPGDVFSNTTLLGEVTLNSGNSEYEFSQLNFLTAQSAVDPGSEFEVFSAITIANPVLSDRSVPVRVKIDYTDSLAYQKSLQVAELLGYFDNGPDDWPTSAPPDFRTSKSVLTPSEGVDVLLAARCPFDFGYRLYTWNGPALDRYGTNGQPISYDGLVAQALADLAENAQVQGSVEDGGSSVIAVGQSGFASDNSYGTFAALVAAGENVFNVEYLDIYNYGTYHNFIIVDINAGSYGSASCPTQSPEKFFDPRLFTFPVNQDGPDEIRSYPPLRGVLDEGEDIDVAEFVSYIEDPVFEFVVDIPLSAPLDGDSRDTILCAYNDSTFSSFRGQEDVLVANGYDYDVTADDLSANLLSLQDQEVVLGLPNQTDYNYSFSGDSAEAAIVRGRRVRLPVKANPNSNGIPKALEAFAPDGFQSIIFDVVGNIVCRPTPTQEELDPPFCLDFGASCVNDKRIIALGAQVAAADAPVIQDGNNGADADSGDDTSNGDGGTTTTTTTTSTSTKDATPEDATASLITKTSSTTTKTTINKKY